MSFEFGWDEKPIIEGQSRYTPGWIDVCIAAVERWAPPPDSFIRSERSITVTVRLSRWRGALPRALLLALLAALTPLPAWATDSKPADKANPTRPSMRETVARTAARTPLASPAARRAEQRDTSTTRGSFFKTRPGMIALAVMGVGTGYAIYSIKHDRVASPAAGK
jgi:hypothetical protein